MTESARIRRRARFVTAFAGVPLDAVIDRYPAECVPESVRPPRTDSRLRACVIPDKQ